MTSEWPRAPRLAPDPPMRRPQPIRTSSSAPAPAEEGCLRAESSSVVPWSKDGGCRREQREVRGGRCDRGGRSLLE
jgi:hypothetical protein